MATKASRPGRTLVIFAAVIALMYVAAASLGNWKPKLGLDLSGGTRITLVAKSQSGTPSSSDLSQAADIISQRVNGAGVSEAAVSTQGSNIINVEIPGKSKESLARSIGSTAELRFRLVKLAIRPAQPTSTPTKGGTSTTPGSGGATSPTPTTGGSSTPTPTTGGSTPTTSGNTTPSGAGSSSPGSQPTASGTKNRVGAGWLDGPNTPTIPTPSKPPAALVPPNLVHIPDPLAWAQQKVTTQEQHQLAAFVCPAPGVKSTPQVDLPTQPLMACDSTGNRYLLSPAIIEGQQVTSANAEFPSVSWDVAIGMDGSATSTFANLTAQIYSTNGSSGGPKFSNPNYGQQQFAIVLDGKVISAPVVSNIINNGQSQISGGNPPFTETSAKDLANSLKYGALPLSFTIENVSQEGPELASSQLDAGILAGIAGMILVVAYCLLYYRALGFVVISSLLIAGSITYAMVLLLGHAYGFTLTLPGVAGLIVAVGITADSFIVYFERLRDEVRDGKTLRTSVETGWARAKHTILAADGVSILAALILFIFAIGDVKGFAFALGLTTLIDVFVVFFFTKPMVTLLARTHFFGQGHKWSGLDRKHLGVTGKRAARPATATGGEA
ncbi:MAG: protein translocase subunit SecD [Nocardioidaceae bacterium]